MPLRYFLFSTLVLTAAFGLSGYVAKIQQDEAALMNPPDRSAPLMVDQAAQAETISGSSIAPGGVGGRQSQFSAVFGG
jgi:hypothetical protein